MTLNYSLITHDRGYHLSAGDILSSVITGFSGVPYAVRHQELGHRWLALLMYCPIVGGLAAVLERVAVLAFQHYAKSEAPSPLTPERVIRFTREVVDHASDDEYETETNSLPVIVTEQKVAPPIPASPPPPAVPMQPAFIPSIKEPLPELSSPPLVRQAISHVTQCQYYYKGMTKTNRLVPSQKQLLGGGQNARVHIHTKNNDWVVKKSFLDLGGEFQTGVRLDHHSLVRMHAYYIKASPSQNPDLALTRKHKIVMERVHGNTIFAYARDAKIPHDNLGGMIQQVADCAQYLFDERTVWKDLNPGNIIISADQKSFKLIDFEFWTVEENRHRRALEIIIGGVTILKRLISVSELYRVTTSDSIVAGILLPPAFFGKEVFLQQLDKSGRNLDRILQEQVNKLEDHELSEWISNYFDQVSKNFAQWHVNAAAGA